MVSEMKLLWNPKKLKLSKKLQKHQLTHCCRRGLILVHRRRSYRSLLHIASRWSHCRRSYFSSVCLKLVQRNCFLLGGSYCPSAGQVRSHCHRVPSVTVAIHRVLSLVTAGHVFSSFFWCFFQIFCFLSLGWCFFSNMSDTKSITTKVLDNRTLANCSTVQITTNQINEDNFLHWTLCNLWDLKFLWLCQLGLQKWSPIALEVLLCQKPKGRFLMLIQAPNL